jgi:predicted transcriptional regulator
MTQKQCDYDAAGMDWDQEDQLMMEHNNQPKEIDYSQLPEFVQFKNMMADKLKKIQTLFNKIEEKVASQDQQIELLKSQPSKPIPSSPQVTPVVNSPPPPSNQKQNNVQSSSKTTENSTSPAPVAADTNNKIVQFEKNQETIKEDISSLRSLMSQLYSTFTGTSNEEGDLMDTAENGANY